ncbi:hypothetical protein, partial [Cupriavidus metallidurans]|uniref:hypothetical protein n=1 Tax=Cupriavidus metallidurans TaxID=119219 RepID=UPI000568D7FF
HTLPNGKVLHFRFEAATCNSVEQDAGINLSKNQLAYRTATLRSGGVVPVMLTQILVKVEGK